MTRRRFNANPPKGISRCTAVVTLRDRTTADCMRRAVAASGDRKLCAQHQRIADAQRAISATPEPEQP